MIILKSNYTQKYITSVYIMCDNLNRELFRYFRYYIIDRIIDNCHLSKYDNSDKIKKHNTIVASISRKDPDYWYEWIRDSAIVINMMIDLIVSHSVDFIKSIEMMEIIKDYVANNLKIQDLAISKTKIMNDNCEFTVTLGEPKFYTDLMIYEKPWGRPQNDGPALRAIGMIKLVKYLITRKTDDKIKDFSYIRSYLYGYDTLNNILIPSSGSNISNCNCNDEINIYRNSSSIKLTKCNIKMNNILTSSLETNLSDTVSDRTLIKRDLDYVVNEWENRCFDLWEEIEGHHFYTLMIQHHSLIKGLEIALLFGDNTSAHLYKETADKIHNFIMSNFYREGKIFSSIGIINQKIKERYIDLSVLLAFIHTSTPYNEELLNTMADTVVAFIDKYTVNKNKSLYLVGRYLDDTYYGGNPWILTTAALAYMLITIEIKKLNITKLNDKFYQVFGFKNEAFRKLGIKIIKDLIDIEEQNGDTMMSFAEQIDKRTLMYKSADRLTWNYVELLRTILQLHYKYE